MAVQTYFDRYKELQAKYKIKHSTYDLTPGARQEDDVIEECRGYGYAHTKYRVVKNGPGLSTQDLAIICDRGNLCFGHRTEGSIICVYID